MQHTPLFAAGASARPTGGLAPHAGGASAILRPALEMLLLTLLSALIGRRSATAAPGILRILSTTILCRIALATRACDGWDEEWDDESDDDQDQYYPVFLPTQGRAPQAAAIEYGLIRCWYFGRPPNRGMRLSAPPRPAPHPAHPLPDH